jgi:hypothetical protein
VYCDASDVVTAQLTLAGVQAASDVNSQLRHALSERGGASHGSGRPVECREEPVPGVLDYAALEAGDPGSGDLVVLLEQFAPASVAEFDGPCVESTMSVNRTVASTRSAGGLCR